MLHILSTLSISCILISPSVAFGDSSLVRGSLRRCRAREFFDMLKGTPNGVPFLLGF